MSPQQLEHFRALIEARLAGTEAAIAKANANAGTVMLDQSSVGRLSRMDAMQQQAMASGLRAVLQRERLRLAAAPARPPAKRCVRRVLPVRCRHRHAAAGI